MSTLLEKCFSTITEQKTDFESYFQNMMGNDNPFNKLTDIAKQNFALWQSMQKTNPPTKADKKTKKSVKTKSSTKPK